ncbi:probable purple acid phosphatase 20 [Tanacetum coccineum]|uniref:acid phosphatase n=1 Tax=Tanacetum coccineum TaxID=301880 RepID=A0ABQ5F3X5_9ASTR
MIAVASKHEAGRKEQVQNLNQSHQKKLKVMKEQEFAVDEQEKEELRACLDIVPRDDIAINVESLSTKYLIDDWKTHILTENMMYYQIIRVDGSSKNYKIFSEMLYDFDRQYVVDLYRLVKERFETASLEGYDRLLWGDLIIKTYPSYTEEMLSRMLSRRLEVDHKCEMAYELLRTTDLGQTEWTKSTLEHISQSNYDVFILPGDLSYADTIQPSWDSFGCLVEPLASRRPWMVTPGDHDVEKIPATDTNPFTAYNARWHMPYENSSSFSNLYYSFEVSKVHVTMLSSYTLVRDLTNTIG